MHRSQTLHHLQPSTNDPMSPTHWWFSFASIIRGIIRLHTIIIAIKQKFKQKCNNLRQRNHNQLQQRTTTITITIININGGIRSNIKMQTVFRSYPLRLSQTPQWKQSNWDVSIWHGHLSLPCLYRKRIGANSRNLQQLGSIYRRRKEFIAWLVRKRVLGMRRCWIINLLWSLFLWTSIKH